MLKNLRKMIKIPNLVKYMSTPKCQPESSFRCGISVVFGKYLLVTNTLSSGLLMMIGDAFQQEIEYQQKTLKKRYDYKRLSNMFIVGLGMGPLNHFFYVWMANLMPDRNRSTTMKKIILDQIIMSPISITVFFFGMGFLEKKSIPECTKELKSKFVNVYVMDCLVCAPSQVINFQYVPVKYQVFYINTVAVIYNIFLSYYKHKTGDNE